MLQDCLNRFGCVLIALKVYFLNKLKKITWSGRQEYYLRLLSVKMEVGDDYLMHTKSQKTKFKQLPQGRLKNE